MVVAARLRRLSLGRMFGNVVWNPASFLHTFLLGTVYVSLACSRTLLIKLSIRGGGYEYLPVTVNIFAELFKLTVCFSLYLHLLLCKERKSAGKVLSVCDVNWRELLKWAVPGLLYFCDNLIGFYILLHLSAAVYTLMQNFVIISTAVLFRIILRFVYTLPLRRNSEVRKVSSDSEWNSFANLSRSSDEDIMEKDEEDVEES